LNDLKVVILLSDEMLNEAILSPYWQNRSEVYATVLFVFAEVNLHSEVCSGSSEFLLLEREDRGDYMRGSVAADQQCFEYWNRSALHGESEHLES
jgi:hypothetical protein